MLTRLARLETRENFSVSSWIEYGLVSWSARVVDVNVVAGCGTELLSMMMTQARRRPVTPMLTHSYRVCRHLITVHCWHVLHVITGIADYYWAHIRHTTKSNDFVMQFCCSTKLPVWHRELPNFWFTSRATKLLDKNHLYSSTITSRSFARLWLVSCLFTCPRISLSNIHLTPLIERWSN